MLILKLFNKDVQVESMEVQVTIYDLQALGEILSFVTKETMTSCFKWLYQWPHSYIKTSLSMWNEYE